VNEYLENNRSLWDGWTRLHERSEFYDLDSFKAGRSSLKPLEIEEVGDVRGRSLLHLQCHFGQDTLSWARRGAQVTGADFSGEAVRLARALAVELGIPARFVRSNVYDLPQALGGERFDIVFTSYGVLAWLPDLDRWAEVIAHLLKPGGFFYIVEFHPLFEMLDDAGGRFSYPYFPAPRPLALRAVGSYAAREATDFEHDEYNWPHPLSEVINAVLGAGLRLEYVHEFDYVWHAAAYAHVDEFEPGKGRVRGPMGLLPHMFSLRARRGE
jgi:SAM-dependent methyltransferase